MTLRILMLFLCLAAGLRVSAAHADHEILFTAPGFGTLDKFNPEITDLRLTGVHRWTYIQERGAANMLPAVITGLEETSAEFGVLMQYDPNGWRQIASSGLDFIYGNASHGACGSWAIGCIPDFLSGRQSAVYDSVAMAQWPVRSQTEVVLHETLHKVGNFAEGYRHDTSTPCGGNNRANRSVMGCGLLNAQFLGDYEREAWVLSHGVNRPSVYGHGRNEAGAYIYWCNPESRASRVAIMAYTPADGGYRWTGEALPLRLDANRCQGFLYEPLVAPWELPCFSLENGASTRLGRGDLCIPRE